jgi:hypothetical protein
MKKLILSAYLIGLGATGFAQGFIELDNINNTSPSPTATTNGLFFLDTGSGPVSSLRTSTQPFTEGRDSANLVLINSFFGAATTNDNAANPGTFIDPTENSYQIAGATNEAFFRIEAWVRFSNILCFGPWHPTRGRERGVP